ncbi:MAG: polysaccharide biosynthesis tyrosine autokinase [Deltaproteobacteria bacterium]|nr:polysaccharide biosynthesis tyrosine autokinase [Deltaproteobacteria bacterium]
MSKTYDALLKAQREQIQRKEKATSSAQKVSPAFPPERAPVRTLTERERLTSCVVVGSFTAKPDSLMAEQFRKMRSMITTHNLANSLRSLVVTSCMPGEGKTTVTLNLSSIMAQGLDGSVILIDADLRRLKLTSLLGLAKAPGLFDLLEERVSLEEVMVPTEIEGLTLIPAGIRPSNAGELVGSRRMNGLIQELKGRYRDSYIIIDSTPIISTSEVSALSQMVDGIIVVIMADKTRRDLVKRELRTINREKILGVVLNCAEFETSDYYGGYYKQYYGKEKD